MKGPATFVAVLGVVLAGCGTISDARDAQDDAKAVPGERTPTAEEIGLPSTGPLATYRHQTTSSGGENPTHIAHSFQSFLCDEAWEEARKNRRALAVARAREQGAEHFVDAPIAALLPSIDASAGVTASGPTSPLTWNWSFGPSLSWILLDGFQSCHSIDGGAANLRSARAGEAAVEQQVRLEVRTAHVSLEGAKERLDLAALTVTQAEQNLDLIQGRYDIGRATAVELTDAQVALATARADRVQARADYDTSIIVLPWKSLGRTA